MLAPVKKEMPSITQLQTLQLISLLYVLLQITLMLGNIIQMHSKMIYANATIMLYCIYLKKKQPTQQKVLV